MTNLKFISFAIVCVLLFANCQSDKTKKRNDSKLITNEKEITKDSNNKPRPVLNEEENIEDNDIDSDYLLDGEEELPEELIMERNLSIITYKLDWTSLKDGCKAIKKDGFHVIRWSSVDEVNNTDTTGLNNEGNTEIYKDYPYTQRDKRFVLENGKNIIYNPNMTVDDFGLIGTKECIMHLAAINMRTDPRIKDSESFDDIFKEMRYYLLYRDKNVKQDIKDIAEEHYLAACKSFNEQGLRKVLKTSKMRMFYNPSHAKGIIAIEFNFDKNGYLEVKSAYIELNFDVFDDTHWTIFV